LWQLVDGVSSELWTDSEGRVLAGPALSPDGRQLAFSVQRQTGVQLFVMGTDGRGVRRIGATLDVRGSPDWSPDGAWIAIAALDGGIPRPFKVPIDDGTPVRLGDAYALDPVWSPSGDFLVFSSVDVGTNFTVGAVNADGTPHDLPDLVLSRGPRRFGFLSDDELVVLRGDLTHKEFWSVDLGTGHEQQLTSLGRGPTINDFDVSKDGREIVFDRVRDESDIMLIELPD
jgi:Tol biopolymer transport system component